MHRVENYHKWQVLEVETKKPDREMLREQEIQSLLYDYLVLSEDGTHHCIFQD